MYLYLVNLQLVMRLGNDLADVSDESAVDRELSVWEGRLQRLDSAEDRIQRLLERSIPVHVVTWAVFVNTVVVRSMEFLSGFPHLLSLVRSNVIGLGPPSRPAAPAAGIGLAGGG